MSQSQTLPLFGLGVGTKSAVISAQTRQNMYIEQYGEPDKARLAYFARPGMVRKVFTNPPIVSGGNTDVTGPWRGVSNSSFAAGVSGVPDGLGFVAQGNSLTVLTPAGQALATAGDGKYRTHQGPVRFADNGFQTISVDGLTGLIWDYRSQVLPAVPTDLGTYVNFPAFANTVAYLAGYFICDDQSVSGQFRWSASQDGTTWPSLNFANATADPDPLLGVFVARGQLMLLGTRTIEWWQPSGTISVFQAVLSAVTHWGCLAYDTIRLAGDTVVMLARGMSGHGNPQVIAINGYQAQPISTPEVEWDITQIGNPDDSTAFTMTIAGHMFYGLNLIGKTWVYDFTNQTWNTWATDNGRFAGTYVIQVGSQTYISDYRDGRVYNPNVNIATDDGNVLSRQVTTRHTFANGDWTTLDELVIDLEVGDGIPSGATPLGTTTYGISNLGTSLVAGNNQGILFATMRFVVPSGMSATLQSLGAYIDSGAAGSCRFGCYADAAGLPGTLVAQTPSFSAANGICSAPVISPVTLPPGFYWIAAQFTSATVSVRYIDTTPNTTLYYYPFTYNPFDSTFNNGAAFLVSQQYFLFATCSTTPILLGTPVNLANAGWGTGYANNVIAGQKIKLPSAGQIVSVSLRIKASAGNISFALYDATGVGGQPGNLIAQSASQAVVSEWNTGLMTAQPLCQPASYWLVYTIDSNTFNAWINNSTLGDSYFYNAGSYGAFPPAFNAAPTPDNSFLDMYATFQLAPGLGQSGNPYLMLQWSKDGGRTFGNEVWQSSGPIGAYKQRAVWRALGRARDWVFRFVMSDPARLVVVNAYARGR